MPDCQTQDFKESVYLRLPISTIGMEHNYQKLSIWKRSIEFVKSIYDLTKVFPKEEKFGLVNQMRRCAISIPSNIAEGSIIRSNKHFSHYLSTSIGSVYELHSQLIVSMKLEIITESQFLPLEKELFEIRNMLVVFTKKIEEA